MTSARLVENLSHPEADKQIKNFAILSVAETFAILETAAAGLSPAEAQRRRDLFGPNKLPHAKKRVWYLELAGNFIHFFAIMLWIGAALAWAAGLPELSYAIVIVIFVNGLFSYWQEYRAERAAEALQALLPHQVTVRRNGQERLTPADEVVRGDVLVLSEGETVPADARLIAAEKLRLDLSSLTGESRPVPRSTVTHLDGHEPAVYFPNLVFAGTSVASGRGEAVVYAIGAETEFGRLAALTQEQKKDLSPLERELQRVTRIVTILAVGLGVLFFVVGVMVGGLSLTAAFIFAIGIIVANVPEGLLPTLTLALAFGVKRMAKRKALVKRLSAVETLGATTIILTDKTGTLTENEMTVRRIWANGGYFGVTGNGYEPVGALERTGDAVSSETVFLLLRTAALCCDAHLVPPSEKSRKWEAVGDPTEAAILVAAAKAGLDSEALGNFPRLSELPFDSVRKRMSAIHRIDGSSTACVKGALNEMLRLCNRIRLNGQDVVLDAGHRDSIQSAHDFLAHQGLRVLAVASREIDATDVNHGGEWRTGEVERDLTFLGLLAMEDPPRPEVAAAIRSCREAGVRVVMMTGDDGTTAAAVGREIGLHESRPRVITGQELDLTDDIALTKLLAGPDILFARVAPEHKLRVVEACQTIGEVVAVTGDGVNDAPALKKADIGVAMGLTGTDVAREAADMVLTDDNFASIVHAIREGRAVYDNIRKFIGYCFGSNAAEMMPFVVFVLFGVPLPLTIMQVLAVDVGTDLFPALALGAEKPEPDVMKRPPRRRSEGLLNRATLIRSYLWLGMIEAGLALTGFFYVQWLAGWRAGSPFISDGAIYLTATTVTFAGIVMAQIGNAFAWRSERQSIFRLGFFTNRLLIWCIVIEVGLMMLLIYVPPFTGIFGMSPPEPRHWLFVAAFGPVLLLLEEFRKLWVRRTSAA